MPFDDNEAKKLLRSLIATFEHLLYENIALKSILQNTGNAKFQETWPPLLAELMAHPEGNQVLHSKFLSLYEKADRIMDEATALAVLRSIPDLKRPAH